MKIRYYFKGSFTILTGLLMLSVAAVSNAEDITLTTYYPSPYGVYSEMRLAPKTNPTACGNTQEGLMFYSNGSNPLYSQRGLYVCGSGGNWQLIGGGFWAASPSNSNNIYNTNSGNVGIGTNNPVAKFQITSPNAAVGSFYFGAALGPPSSLGASQDISFDGGSGSQFYFNNFGPDSTGETGFAYRNNPILVMKNSGNVGIGTTDPLQQKLYVNANTGIRNGIQIRDPRGHYVSMGGGIGTDGSVTAGLHIGTQAGINIGGEGGTVYYDYDPFDRTLVLASTYGIRSASLGGDTVFSTGNTNVERMRITNSGNVGIGTTNPGARLHVVGTMGCQFPGAGPWGGDLFYVAQEGSRPVVRIRDDDGFSNPVLQFAKSDVSWMNLEFSGDTITIGGGGPVSRVRISNISIGGPHPGYSASWPYETIGLPPGNNLRVNFGSTEKYMLGDDGWGRALAGWTTYSDQRFKENAVELTDVMRALKNIRGVRFSWKTKEFLQKGFPEGTQIGFIAQEVEKEFPELVATDPDGYKSLDYGKLTPVLLEAIKEQQKQIDGLKAENETLKVRLDTIEQKLK